MIRQGEYWNNIERERKRKKKEFTVRSLYSVSLNCLRNSSWRSSWSQTICSRPTAYFCMYSYASMRAVSSCENEKIRSIIFHTWREFCQDTFSIIWNWNLTTSKERKIIIHKIARDYRTRNNICTSVHATLIESVDHLRDKSRVRVLFFLVIAITRRLRYIRRKKKERKKRKKERKIVLRTYF